MTIARIIVIAVVIFSTQKCFAQTEQRYWQQTVFAPATVEKYIEGTQEHTFSTVLYQLYQEVFSKPDGERCPFAPSCSAFAVELVKRTNLIEALLLTGDRLLRDSNFFGRKSLYPIKAGKLLDPPEEYLFHAH